MLFKIFIKSKFFFIACFFFLAFSFAHASPLAIDILNEDDTGQVPQIGNTGNPGPVIGPGSSAGNPGPVIGPGSGAGNSCPPGQLCNPIAADSIAQLVATILDIVVKIGAPIIIFFLIYVGFLFTTARGNTETLGTAKKALVWTLVGGLIILGASAIAEVVCSTITEISGTSACS